jgi:uracil-DNA glycosylase
MDKETLQQLHDWLQFFRDLGFEDVYERPPAQVPCDAASQISNSPAAASDWRFQISNSATSGDQSQAADLEDQESVPTPPVPVRTDSGQTPRAALPEPRIPGTPAQSLSLFEAASPGAPTRPETLKEIRDDLGDCHRCKLWGGRKHIVFGQGNPRAELVFVGEGPGADEDEQGLPFVGRAGQLLNRMLQLVSIRREDVYICNVVKCRPPGNRTPETDEISACSPFLFRQIAAIQPRLVCCLGAPAARTVLGIKEGITKIHGRLMDYGGAKAMATVHPAYVLRNMREEKILREDFEKIREFLKGEH